jgi:hypothetical protein
MARKKKTPETESPTSGATKWTFWIAVVGLLGIVLKPFAEHLAAWLFP